LIISGKYFLSSGASFSEIILIGGAILLDLPLPLLAADFMINLIDHGLPSFALSFEREEDDVMS
jgi:hypothetical protein